MGHPAMPIPTDYYSRKECLACSTVIFGGRTPYFMKALFSGITPCKENPPTGVIPPIYLQQWTELPCFWDGYAGEFAEWYAQYWANYFGWSYLIARGPGGDIFESQIEGPCKTSFGNDQKCEEGDDYEGGGGSVRWGEKIDEEFYETW